MKTLPYAMSLLIAGLSPLGCSHNDSALGDSATINGTIDSWTSGSGATVAATVLSVPLSTTVLATATIDDSGNFSIALPDGDALAPFLKGYTPPSQGTACSVLPTIDPSGLQLARLLLTVKKDGSPDATLVIEDFKASTPPISGSLSWSLMYADRDAHINGQANCSMPNNVDVSNFNLELQKGWNSVTTHIDKYNINPTAGVDVVTENYAGPIPASVKWQTTN